MVLKFKFFTTDKMTINLLLSEPTKLQIFFTAIPETTHITCGGAEMLLTRSTIFKGCEADGTQSDNNCAEAFSLEQFWMPTEDPAFVNLNFLELIQPTKIVYQPNPLTNLKPNIITLF